MRKHFLFFLSIFMLISFIDVNYVYAQKNSGFESGLEGWEGIGKISFEVGNQSYKGSACVKLEGPKAEVFQRVGINPLSIILLNAFAKTSQAGVQAYSFIRFFDDADHLIIEYKGKTVTALSYQNTGYYTIAPAKSKYLAYGVLKETGEGIVYADEIDLKMNVGENEAPKTPLVNLDQYLQPFWKADTIYNETVLLLSENNGRPSGKLLFNPSGIISVKSFDLQNSFSEGIDFTLIGNIITKIDGSTIPSRTDTSFSKNDLAWYDLQSQWIVVTYVHKDKWSGIVPEFKGRNIPNTLKKLTTGSPLRIVACGTSITRGMDVSGYNNVPPFMPPYVNLFAHQLKIFYGYNDIKLFNAGLPGGVIDWMAQFTDEYINALDPDLVIIDFGMNDFWRYTPAQFKQYVEAIINKCKAHNKKVEFLLISNMKFDPEYIRPENDNKSFYESNLAGYNNVLQSLCSKGIINLDMTSLSDEIYQRKKAKDCIVNPLHPNDYLARWYAQGMATLFMKP